jgi:hypothetical protein
MAAMEQLQVAGEPITYKQKMLSGIIADLEKASTGRVLKGAAEAQQLLQKAEAYY